MAHEHDHGHAAAYDRAFAVGVGLNVSFVVIEAIFGVLSNSLALLADAGHNLSDVLALLLAWGASALSRRQVGSDVRMEAIFYSGCSRECPGAHSGGWWRSVGSDSPLE